MTPFEEFTQLRNLGPVGYQWWKKQARIIANRYNFPPPPGHRSWTDDASADWLGEAFARRGKYFVAKIAALASDEQSYGRVVRASIKNEFADGAKATTEGKLRGRMRTILPQEAGFVDATGLYGGKRAWTLDSLGDAVWTGDWDDLLRLPGYSREQIGHLNPAGPTSADNRRRLVEATRVMLEAAGGAVLDLTVARVLVHLFDLEDVAPYLLGDEQVVTTDNAFNVVGHVIDVENGWEDPREYEAAVEWFKMVDEANAVIAELSHDEQQTLSRLDEGELGSVSAAFRAAATRLGTSREGMLIAISKCAQLDFRE